MTTILVTDTEIAWDSLQTFDNERSISPTDKVRVVGKKIIAFGGDTDLEEHMVKWIGAGADPLKRPAPRENSEFEMLVIDKNGITLYSTANNGIKVSAPLGIGTGGQLARGAIAYGEITGTKVSALDAVRAAALVDIYTGGTIKTLNIKKALGRKRAVK